MKTVENIRNRYRGKRAEGYEERRAGYREWALEHAALDSYLADLPPLAGVLDVPCGTGRFASIYKRRRFNAWGLDTSPDMVEIARRAGVPGQTGDLFKIRGEWDAVVCFRFLNWCNDAEMRQAVAALCGAARTKVVLSIRLGEPTDADNSPHFSESFEVAYRGAGFELRREAIIDDKGYAVKELVRT